MDNQRQKTLYALVRGIPDSFDQCIKPEVGPQAIDIPLARVQHKAYVDALSLLGCVVIMLPPDDRLPDCPFVEDTAVVLGGRALITRPGAPSRRGEEAAVAEVLGHFLELTFMNVPATLDGGDVLQIGGKIFVGRTDRTNGAGIATLARWAGETCEVVPVPIGDALHLKSVANCLGDKTIVLSRTGIDRSIFSGFEVTEADENEAEGLSFLSMDNVVLLPSDCPKTRKMFEAMGRTVISLDVSEIRKAQAGLTCMSVFFEA